MPLLPFAQLDFAGRLAVDEGRYLVRPQDGPDSEPDVLAVRILGAARARGRLKRGKVMPIETGTSPTPLQLSRVTLIKSVPFEDAGAAETWLERISSDKDLSEGLAREVSRTYNRAMLAHRVSAPDPYAADVNAGNASAIRFGFGTGDEVAEGRWEQARELPEERREGLRSRIYDGVGAQLRISGVLKGADAVGPEEELLIDAERALSERRLAKAALCGNLALEVAARRGTDVGEARGMIRPLNERAMTGREAEISREDLEKALRASRKAIRAKRPGQQ